MSLSVAGERKTAYISRIRLFYRIGDIAECRRLSARLSSQLSSTLSNVSPESTTTLCLSTPSGSGVLGSAGGSWSTSGSTRPGRRCRSCEPASPRQRSPASGEPCKFGAWPPATIRPTSSRRAGFQPTPGSGGGSERMPEECHVSFPRKPQSSTIISLCTSSIW